MRHNTGMPPLRGSLWVLVLYDVAEQIQLDKLPALISPTAAATQPRFKHPAPDYVRFEKAPVVEDLGTATIESGQRFRARAKYFDYGVISVELQLPFEVSWQELVGLSHRWILAPEIERCSSELLRGRRDKVGAALVQPYASPLSEDYYIIHLEQALDPDDKPSSAAALLASHGDEIAQMVRGESQPLSDAERNEVLQSRLSYYPNDLLLVGWVAALVYDTPEGAAPTIQLLEYANTQLLEFRHYDDLLTRVLENVYKTLEHRGGGFFRRWRMASEAARLNTLRLDVTELTERTDNAIKFLSDMFYARAYRMAASRVGVPDYRHLVEEKLHTAGELYDFMMNEFHQARAFVLEAMVVVILVIELVHVFR